MNEEPPGMTREEWDGEVAFLALETRPKYSKAIGLHCHHGHWGILRDVTPPDPEATPLPWHPVGKTWGCILKAGEYGDYSLDAGYYHCPCGAQTLWAVLDGPIEELQWQFCRKPRG